MLPAAMTHAGGHAGTPGRGHGRVRAELVPLTRLGAFVFPSSSLVLASREHLIFRALANNYTDFRNHH